ncbi:MAG: ubiquinol-cytochrome c reductase cytochrome b subunit [Conexibacter sp.]|jgi:ubiquinol-cytochrome c reductase cytochrome b subunit|nr:ubiquinol-cytochrome c reductase cytochrome b subunit [Conexibacter sp.]MDX6732959.1 ubiquinol-cytochrome c reductase cytochrome b subunit [Baekduia sp.]
MTERDPIDFVDQRLGASTAVRKALRYLFPDHWSFMLGEVALYSFLILVATGIFLALFYEPSLQTTVYHGSYAPLRGAEVSRAYDSTVNLSFDVPGGLLMRQTHHWAAHLFLVSIVLHLMRVFFTGAFRRPREFNYMIGVTMLGLGLLEGFLGYSLPDDLLSGMGLAIAYSVAMSIPLVGGPLAVLLWGGEFPGAAVLQTRLEIAHVFVLPAVLATLIAVHLVMVMRQHHSQFPGPGRTERNVVGSPLWPGYALRSLSLLAAVAGLLVLLGGLVQINPVWEWGPFEPYLGSNGAQPDWYLGWLIGALRLMPNFEPTVGGATLVPNPFFGGLLFPTVVFATLYAWPWLEERVRRDRARHELLDRPRDNPTRTAIGAAFLTWVVLVFVAGSADRVLLSIGFSYAGQIRLFRVLVFVAPVLVYLVTKRICRELRDRELHPVRTFTGEVVQRAPDGRIVRR